jgi:beta-lactamase class A
MKSKKWFTTIALSAMLGSTITWGVQRLIEKREDSEYANQINLEYKRGQGFKYIKPLRFVENKLEDPDYLSLKKDLQTTIDSLQQSGSLSSASVYLRDFDKSGWIHVNPDYRYHPGSLLKMGALFNILQQAELDSNFLGKAIVYKPTQEFTPPQTFNTKSIKEGEHYSIEQLLEYMIAFSDNKATSAIHPFIQYQRYLKNFRELNLSDPVGSNANYLLKANEISVFLKVLYNGTFLSPLMSEKAMDILMKCDFKKGMSAGLPPTVPIAHKFGEYGNSKGDHELHETGIIYLREKPYLLTIMTSGKKVENLASSIALLTKKTSHYLLHLPSKKH